MGASMAQEEVNAVVESISSSDCETSTIDTLRRLLQMTTTNVSGKVKGIDKATGLNGTTQSRSTSKAKTKTSSRAKTTLAKDDKLPPQALTSSERLALATEVFNRSLKALSVSQKSDGRAYQRSPIRQALRDASTNSPTRKPRQRPSSPPSGADTADPNAGNTIIADCAHLAIKFLCLNGGKTPSQQLNSGLSALVSRLLSRGMVKEAARELKFLKSRLEPPTAVGGATTRTEVKRTGRSNESSREDPIASLLDIDSAGCSNDKLQSIVGFQIQVIRLITIVDRSATVTAALPYIAASNPTSPTSRLTSLARDDPIEGKAAQQLDQLSRLLLSLCPSVSSASDDDVRNGSRYPTPSSTLSIQVAGLQARVRSWRAAKHNPDIRKELWEPLAKCGSAYLRRTSECANEAYVFIKHCLETIRQCLKDDGYAQEQYGAPVLAVLSNAAETNAKYDDAIKWTTELAVQLRSDSASAAELAAVLVRLAALSLAKDWHESTGATEDALAALKGDLVGKAQDQDMLLATVMAWRKTATHGIVRLTKLEANNGAHDEQYATRLRECLRAIGSSSYFLPRYIGTGPQPSDAEAKFSRFQARATLASKALRSVLDSLAVCVQSCSQHLCSEWDIFRRALDDCYLAISQLHGAIADGDLQNVRLRLARICWSWHTLSRDRRGDRHKREQATQADTVHALELCVKILRDSDAQVQADGAFLLRLERLAMELLSLKRYADASEVLREATWRLVSDGVLGKVVANLSRGPLTKAWKEDRTVQQLSSILGLSARLRSKTGKAKYLADYTAIGVHGNEEIAALLEWQLMNSKTVHATALNELAERLLDLYDHVNYPLRRLRAAAHILQQAHATGTQLSDSNSMVAKACTYPPRHTSLGKDVELAVFAKHYEASHAAACAFTDPTQCIENIKVALDCCSSTSHAVDDVDAWIAQLKLMTQCLNVYGPQALSIAGNAALLRALTLGGSANARQNEQCRVHCELAIQHMSVGNVDLAWSHLEKVEHLIAVSDASELVDSRVAHAIASAHLYLEAGDPVACQQRLNQAEALLEQHLGSAPASGCQTDLGGLRLNSLIADATLVASKYCIKVGHQQDAILYAKQALKLHQRAWASLETKRPDNAAEPSRASSALGNSVTEIGQQDVPRSKMRTMTYDSLAGPRFWACVPALFESQVQCAEVLAHVGLWQEAIYHAEQAERIANAVNSDFMVARITSIMLRYHVKSGHADKAEERVELLASVALDLQDPLLKALVRLEQGRMLFTEGERELAEQHWDDALKFCSLPIATQEFDDLDTKMRSLTITSASMTTKASRIRKGSRARATKRHEATTVESLSPKSFRGPCQAMHTEICSTRILMLLNSGDLESAQLALQTWNDISDTDSPDSARLRTLHSVEWASILGQLETDLQYSTLLESTLSLPMIDTPDHGLGRQISRGIHPLSKPHGKPSKAKKKTGKAAKSTLDKLECLHANLTRTVNSIMPESSDAHRRLLSRAYFSSALLLSSAASKSAGSTAAQLCPVLTLPNARALYSEYNLAKADAILSEPGMWMTWPKLKPSKSLCMFEQSSNQTGCEDLLPTTWSVVSLSLGLGHDELLITRHDAGRAPFVLRLPMRRQRSGDEDDEDVFTYEDGKSELRDIIELSDASTQDNRNMTAKGAKRQWWAEREALDARLRDLLVNIEHIWFGGFKGIFAHHDNDSKLLHQLQADIEKALDKHLPSRRGKNKPPAVQFDKRIVELFDGVRDMTASTAENYLELTNDVTDLLYLLIDALHLNGEHNALDEIDFDALVIDTIDALKSYREATRPALLPTSRPHLVLVLDKMLHGFPWESMPCLEGRSVSRLPSMEALRDRLSFMWEQHNRDCTASKEVALRVSRRRGTNILNPSGDLSDTQSTLTPYVEQLPSSWVQHIGPKDGAPLNEDTVSDALNTSDLFCYYGHGSTAQYIRPRAVRKIGQAALQVSAQPNEGVGESKRCPTSLLMGCSSVAVTENGEFHPHGMILAYLSAGAPAVVGCLWDVTDRDCDRFSVECGRQWGLWKATDDAADLQQTDDKARKGRSRVPGNVEGPRRARMRQGDRSEERGASAGKEDVGDWAPKHHAPGVVPENLAQAVASSRQACYLKYLNGAAMVVYGIPVVLE